MSALQVRDALPADIPAMQGVLRETWHATYDGTLGAERVSEISARWHATETLASELDNRERVSLVALRDGAVVGVASATSEPGRVVLWRLYVLPAEQGRGAGAALLDTVLARMPGPRPVELEVEPDNARAIGFYEKRGFRRVVAQSSCGGDTALTSLLMRLER